MLFDYFTIVLFMRREQLGHRQAGAAAELVEHAQRGLHFAALDLRVATDAHVALPSHIFLREIML